MNDQTEIIIWTGHTTEDVARLVDVLANRFPLELFADGAGRLLRLVDSQLNPTSNTALHQLIAENISTPQLVPDDDNGGLKAIAVPLVLDRQATKDVDAGLQKRLHRVPSTAPAISATSQNNIISRIRCGEPLVAVCKYYGVDAAYVQALLRRAA